MKIKHRILCPHYKGDGYQYEFDGIVFLLCDVCNNKLMNQMDEQAKLENDL